MFKGRIVSRSNVNGKVHTFQKDFDDYDSYQEFLVKNPEYDTGGIFPNLWRLGSGFDRLFSPYANELNSLLPSSGSTIPVDTKYLPKGVDLEKYEKRRLERLQNEYEKANKKYSLERSKAYIEDYLSENKSDNEASEDLKKIEAEIKLLS